MPNASAVTEIVFFVNCRNGVPKSTKKQRRSGPHLFSLLSVFLPGADSSGIKSLTTVSENDMKMRNYFKQSAGIGGRKG